MLNSFLCVTAWLSASLLLLCFFIFGNRTFLSGHQIDDIHDRIQDDQNAGNRDDRVYDTHGDSEGSGGLRHGELHDGKAAVNHDSAGTVQVQFSGVTLAQTAQIVHVLEASPIVAGTTVNTASTTQEGAVPAGASVQVDVLIDLRKEVTG